MRKLLESHYLGKSGWEDTLVEIRLLKGKLTPGQALGVCEVLKKLGGAEINVDEAEVRMNEIFEGR